MTDTREPLVPLLTLKTVPVTATRQSRGGYVQVTGGPFGGLDNHGAARQLKGDVTPCLADCHAGMLTKLNQRPRRAV